MRALTELKKECFRCVGDSNFSRTSCFVCFEDKPKRLLLHHLSYTSKSITYDNFENSDYGRLKYYVNLLDEVREDRYNFLILCINCHKKLEKLLKLSIDDVCILLEQKMITDGMLQAYNKTRVKRGLPVLINPESYKVNCSRGGILYNSFSARVNYILSKPDLDELFEEYYDGEEFCEEFVEFRKNKEKLREFASYIPKSWGYSFYKGTSILHNGNEEHYIESGNSFLISLLGNYGVAPNLAGELCDTINYTILDVTFFRQLIPGLDKS